MSRRSIMRRGWFGLAALLVVLIGLVAPVDRARAHARSESRALWEVGGDQVHLVMTIPEAEFTPLARGRTAPSDEAAKAYLSTRIFPLADGRRCALIPPIQTLGAQPGYRKFDFTFDCGAYRRLTLHAGAFMDVSASHTNFAQIQNTKSGEFTEQLLTRDRQTIDVIGGEGQLEQAGFLDFVGMGVMHIFTGVDHMAFLLGLVLISRNLKDLLFVVTGFTIGHSVTLALAVTGVLRPHAEYIDALVALTIALIGAENLSMATGRARSLALALGGGILVMAVLKALGIGDLPALLLLGAALFSGNYLMVSGAVRDAGRLRTLITVVFGLVHGFGFASNLLEMQLPPGRLGELLVGFNVGVEVGQTTLVLGAWLGVALLRRLRLAAPRPLVVESASAALVGVGVFWFVQRAFL